MAIGTGAGARDVRQLWQAVLAELQLCMTRANFETYFKDTWAVGLEGQTLVVGVKNPFLQETLEEYYVHALRIWNLALDHAPGLEQAVRGHAPLLRAIWTGKADRAADLMRRHVDEFERAMHKALLRA